MTKVSLRVYNREIEGMIEGSQLDEATAHCQHILKTFPMHIETYRLLGKTFLEARRYGDAADIFQRALMAVPDDFVSHVGMSIIRDDEGKLDDAIWHMERAFEIQPSNSAIQGELRRLYGRRDGVEPPKIRLSRDALANMYSQGELFNQAIAEIRSVLADDPNRPDLQVMLARAYYRAGQKVEAAEMAATLLKKYPYCMDALRVLVDVLPDTSQGENIQIYRHRLGMLDPYSNFTKDTVFASDQVADATVTIERLEYKAGATPAAAQPNWASSLGIQLGNEKRAEPTPDWLKGEGAAEAGAATASEPVSAQPIEGGDSVPDWMKAAGWQPSSGAGQEGPVELEEEKPAESIAQADIPDWLKSMAPAEAAEVEDTKNESPTEPQPGIEGDIPNWLKTMGPAVAAAAEGTGETGSAPEMPPSENIEGELAGGEIPDWLKSMAPSAPAEPVNREAGPAVGETSAASIEPVPAEEGELSDWMKSLAPEASAEKDNIEATPAPVETMSTDQEVAPAEEGEIPDWMKSMAPAASAGTDNIEVAPTPGETMPTDQEAAPAEEGEIPAWMKSMAPTTPTQAENIVAAAAPVETMPTAEEPVTSEHEDLPDWMKSTATEASAEAENIEVAVTPPEKPTLQAVPMPAEGEDMPDWMKSKVPEAPAEAEDIESVVTPTETPSIQTEASSIAEGEMPDWLKSIAPPSSPAVGNIGAEVTPTETPPMEATPEMIDNEESLPDWLKPMPAQEEVGGADKVENEPASVEAPASRVEHEPTEEETFPDWLKSLEPEEKAETDLADTRPSAAVKLTRKVEPTPADEGSFPDWLKHLQGEAEATAASGLVTSAQDLSQSEEPLPLADAQPITDKPLSEVSLPAEPAVQKPVEPIPLDKATENQDFVPSGTAKPLEIGDDALGWLESLAAKQGANADELLTKPQERHEEMPDWLNPNEVQPVTAFAKGPGEITPESLPTTPIDAAGEEVAAVLPPMNEESTSKADETLLPQSLEGEGAQPVRIEDDTMAWLEGLAANQGANPEELLSKPEDRPETAPEWIQNAATEESTQPAEASVMAEAETREVMEPASEEDLTVTTWLSELDKQEGGTDKAVAIPAQEEIPADQGDLPDWLKDMERPTAIEAANEAAVVENKAESDLPDWLRKSTVENEAEQPSITEPISEPAIEEEKPPWMEEPEEVAGLASPTAPEEWIPADGSSTKVDVVEVPEQPPVIEPVAPAVVPVTEKPIPEAAGMVAPIPAQNKDAEILSIAQNALENNSLNAAVKEYSKLIKKGHLIEEVIHDLREAVYRFPVDVIIWQTLGDAYMRANHLQDALDAYSKAEELLR